MENYRESDIRRLKGCLLGLCCKNATKSSEELYKAIRKAGLAYRERFAKEAAERLVELSRYDELVYRVTMRPIYFDPEVIIDHILHIEKETDGYYNVWKSKNERSPPLELDVRWEAIR